jgi:hypothetical protein
MINTGRKGIIEMINKGFSVLDVQRATGYTVFEILLVMEVEEIEAVDDTAYLSPEGWALVPMED